MRFNDYALSFIKIHGKTFRMKKYHNKNLTLLSRVRDRGAIGKCNAILFHEENVQNNFQNTKNSHTVANARMAIAAVGSKQIPKPIDCKMNGEKQKQNHIKVAGNTQQNGVQVIKLCETKRNETKKNKMK